MIDDEALKRYQEQLKALRRRLQELSGKVGNMIPVFQRFEKVYSDIVKQNFEAKGKIMERERWRAYTPAYLKFKKKHYSGKPMLEITGNLKKKAINFQSKIKKDNMIMKVKGEDYLYHVSDRKKYGRKYFYTKDKDMPIQAWRKLIQITTDYIKEVNGVEA